MSILAGIHRFAETNVGGVKTLVGQEGRKRLRIGNFRVVFRETKEEIFILAVRNRKDAYR